MAKGMARYKAFKTAMKSGSNMASGIKVGKGGGKGFNRMASKAKGGVTI